MTGGKHAQGAFSQMLLEKGSEADSSWDGTWDGSSNIFEYLSENIQKHGRIIGGNELTGSRSHRAERTRTGASYFYGSITKYMSPNELDVLLPLMLGANEVATDTFNLSEDLPYFALLFDREAQTLTNGVFEYIDCKVDRWIVRGRAPELGEDGMPDMVTLQLFIIASNESFQVETWPGSPPTLGTGVNDAPYTFCDSTATLFGAARDMSEFVIAGDNKLYARYTNSCTPHSIIPRDRIIQARVRFPWNDTNDDIYADADNKYEGAETITLTNGAYSTAFNFESVWIEKLSPVASKGRQEIELIANYTMRDTGADSDELVVVNDNTT